MKKPRWQAPGDHPDQNLILMCIEGELSENDSCEVAQHLKTCWDCRAYSEQVERGILTFIEYRKESFLPDLPPPPGRWNNFRFALGRATKMAADSPSVGLFESLRSSPRWKASTKAWHGLAVGVPRPAWISASISIVTILALLRFSVLQPPQMQAAEFLRRAVAATQTRGNSGAVVSQRVRIRRGSVVFEQVVARGSSTPTKEVSKVAPDLATKAAMAIVGMDSRSLLSAERFADWRRTVSQKEDLIFESRESVTLRTIPLHDEAVTVRYASLTVNRTDWRPIAEHVEFRNQPPLDVTEISFEMRAAPSVREIQTANVTAAAESIVKTINTELAVRAALHGVGADLGEPIEIRTASGGLTTVSVSGIVATEERKQQLLAALKGIQNVSARLKAESEVAPRELPPPVTRAEPLIVTARSPMEKELLEHFGDPAVVESFSKRAISLTGDLMTRAWALRQLAERYGNPGSKEEVSLSVSSRRLLVAMRQDHYHAMTGATSELTGLLRPVLLSMVQSVPKSAKRLPLFASTQEVQRLTDEALSGTGLTDVDQTNETSRVAGDLLAALRNLEVTLGEQP